MTDTPAMTEPGCQHPQCTLVHPHAGPAVLVDDLGDVYAHREQLVDDVDQGDEAPATEGSPVPAIAGTFAVYIDGKGGYVLVTDVGGNVERRHIPAAMVKLATGGGMFARKLAGVFGGGA